MASIRMRLEEAKSAILDGEFDRGVDLCLAVLSTYPKHVEAHCLLGEALREKGLAEQSERVFLQVLSADPENLMARWAMSILLEERGASEGALYHLERAFELNPGHTELRGELARLSGKPVSLNRSALARLYARGEIWDKALDELEVVSRRNPGRLEIMVPMAEAFWRLDRSDDAGALCEEILADSPDCLKANVILGQVLLRNGDDARARAESLCARASALDPENLVKADLLRGLVEEPALSALESGAVTSGPALDSSSGGVLPGIDDLTREGEPAVAGIRSERPDSEWDDLLREDVSLDDGVKLRLTEVIARLAPAHREMGSGRSILASLEPTARRDAKGVEEQPAAGVADSRPGPHPAQADPSDSKRDAGASPSDHRLECLRRVRENPEDPHSRLELALACHRDGLAEEAVQEYDVLLKLSPDMVDDVVSGLLSLVQGYPNVPRAHRVLGDAYLTMGRYDSAIAEYNLAQHGQGPGTAPD